jgi:hypothetical protein
MTRAFMVLLVLGFLPVPSLAALVEERDVESGQRVRVTTTAGERLTGRVGEKSSDALVLELDDDGGSRTIPLVDVKTLQAGSPQSRCQSAWSKAKWWALIGAASGLTLGLQHEQVGEDGSSFGEAAALGAWSGGLFGGLIGAWIGAANPGEEWVTIYPRVHVGGRDPGFSIQVTLGF